MGQKFEYRGPRRDSLSAPVDIAMPTLVGFTTELGHEILMLFLGHKSRFVIAWDQTEGAQTALTQPRLGIFLCSFYQGRAWRQVIQGGGSVRLLFFGQDGSEYEYHIPHPLRSKSLWSLPEVVPAAFNGLYQQICWPVMTDDANGKPVQMTEPMMLEETAPGPGPDPLAVPPAEPKEPFIELLQPSCLVVSAPSPSSSRKPEWRQVAIGPRAPEGQPWQPTMLATARRLTPVIETQFLPHLRVDHPITMWMGSGRDPRKQSSPPAFPTNALSPPVHEETRPMPYLMRTVAASPSASEAQVTAYIDREFPQEGMNRILLAIHQKAVAKGNVAAWFERLQDGVANAWDEIPRDERRYKAGNAAIRTFLGHLAELAGTSIEDVLIALHKR